MTLIRIICLALMLSHASGILERLVRRALCEQECRRDGCADDCGPGESSCTCHGPATSQLVRPSAQQQLIAQGVAPRVPLRCGYQQRAHSSPDPREILHVPRLGS